MVSDLTAETIFEIIKCISDVDIPIGADLAGAVVPMHPKAKGRWVHAPKGKIYVFII